MTRWLLAAAGALLATACAAEPPRPLLWKVSDADSHVYLLGTFHLLKADDYPLDARVYAALDDAERVFFEVDPAALTDGRAASAMVAASRRSDGKRLQDALTPAVWSRLEQQLAAKGLDAQAMQGLDAWFVALTLAMVEMQQQGLDPALGLDKHIGKRAAAAGKPVAGLETIADQMALFEAMAAEVQAAQLEEALDAAGAAEDIARLHAQWRAGDADGLYDGLARDMRERHPGLYRAINSERNRAWLPRVEAALRDSDEDALVAVGSLHLLGDEGLVALLRAKGYTVERL
jgi:uncharacterized protein YbaP (TraB family)